MNDYKPEIEKLEGEIREMEELINTAPKEIDTCNEVILEEYNIRLILAQAKLQIWKQALTSEIEFLEKLGGLLIIENNPERYKGLEIVSQRIAELKGALE